MRSARIQQTSARTFGRHGLTFFLPVLCLPVFLPALRTAAGFGGEREEPNPPAASLIGIGRISATASDLSGLPGLLDDGTPASQFGGISAIDGIPGTNQYLLLSDRGPKDGAVEYACRFHEMEIAVRPGSLEPVEARLTATTLLRDRAGRRFPGLASAIEPTDRLAARLDPEGLRCDRAGQIYISDEYGPALMKFAGDGRLLARMQVPPDFRVATASADGKEEDQVNLSGRRSNRGMEGLALSPSGRYLTGLIQSPLLQDMQRDEAGVLSGFNSRLLRVDLQTGRQQQFVYRQDLAKNKLHEILAVDDGRMLVIEQDGIGGDAAVFKKIFAIDLEGATELAGGTVLPPGELDESVRPVRKTLLLDLLDPQFGLAGPAMPEKIEGLCWGPWLEDGQRVLIVATDNDFRTDQETQLFVFAVRF